MPGINKQVRNQSLKYTTLEWKCNTFEKSVALWNGSVTLLGKVLHPERKVSHFRAEVSHFRVEVSRYWEKCNTLKRNVSHF